MPRSLIPTHVITGFLGAGKTSAILALLARKPAAEKWAVLVNEFGEIGIDGAILAGSGAEIREVPGGCMCCVADLPMKVALNNLIMRVKPDRLLIEPSGLGHPQEIVDTLTGEYYGEVLDLRAVIALVDPRKFSDARYLDNRTFNDQLRIADVVAANKTDLSTDEDRHNFHRYLEQLPAAGRIAGWITQGRIEPGWLQLPHRRQRTGPPLPPRKSNWLEPPPQAPAAVELKPGEAFVRRENRGDGYYSCGWRFAGQTRFSFQHLMVLFSGVTADRLKAVLHTDRGAFAFNAEHGVLGVSEVGDSSDNVVELIQANSPDWQSLERELLAARCA
jgi:G3E family GTPase